MSDDIILVTIDCWRTDTLDDMPRFSARTDDLLSGSALCQAPATRGAFPSLFAGSYYPQVYADYETLESSIETLPSILAEEGYSTGAIIGSNPFLTAWEPSFDYFWNDDMDFGAIDSGDSWFEGQLSTLRDIVSFARVESRAPARSVAERAQSWYDKQDGPRFLWLHLMDIHVPFLPGFRRGLSAGLLDTYRTHLRFMRDPHALEPEEYDHLEELYRESVRFLDEQIDAIFDIDPDAAKLFVGDHGEEFDHDKFGHARLYEECVKVPLVTSHSLVPSLEEDGVVRHLDISTGILSVVGREPPASWEVSGNEDADRWPVFMLNHSPTLGRVYAAVRTKRYKLIKTFDESMGRPLRIELYDLEYDPGERWNSYGDDEQSKILEQLLDTFLARPDIESGILENDQQQSAAVEERLKALGYR